MSPEEKSKPNHHRPPHLHRGSAPLLSLPTSTMLASCPKTDLDLIQEKMSAVMLLPLRENSTPNHRDVVLFPGVHQDKLNKNTAVQPQYIQVNQSKERARVCLQTGHHTTGAKMCNNVIFINIILNPANRTAR